jgi:hypothetical protein
MASPAWTRSHSQGPGACGEDGQEQNPAIRAACEGCWNAGEIAVAHSLSDCFAQGRVRWPATPLRHRAACRRRGLPSPDGEPGCPCPVRIAIPEAPHGAGLARSLGGRRRGAGRLRRSGVALV